MSVSIQSVGNIPSNNKVSEYQSIDDKIKQLENQIKKVKKDDKMSKEEKDKRIKNLEEQIRRLEEKKHNIHVKNRKQDKELDVKDIPEDMGQMDDSFMEDSGAILDIMA